MGFNSVFKELNTRVVEVEKETPSDCSESSSFSSYWWHFSRRRIEYWHC